ncbi:MAG TPA: hypothetical protein VNP03_19905 [Pseudonocardia sp.]|nr:hypothetical protein [Pseudonocardia sp.]
MSLTPIYDELRELRVAERPNGTQSPRRAPLRLVPAQSGESRVDELAGRGGLGGRHRRPAN